MRMLRSSATDKRQQAAAEMWEFAYEPTNVDCIPDDTLQKLLMQLVDVKHPKVVRTSFQE